MSDIELLDIAGDELDLDRVLKGELTPVFFGSAITNFGVESFLNEFLAMAPSPARARRPKVLSNQSKISSVVLSSRFRLI